MSYVLAAWIIVFATVLVYAGVTMARGRRLARQVPPENRRWM